MTDYKAVKIIRNGCEYNFPQTGTPSRYVDVLVVGGGGGGGPSAIMAGGGGGAGGVVYTLGAGINDETCVIIGEGGQPGCNGGDTCFGKVIACGGGHGGGWENTSRVCASKGGSGGGGGGCNGCGCSSSGLQGYGGADGPYYSSSCSNNPGGGGGGFRGAGCKGNCCYGGTGGIGLCTNFAGIIRCYAGGGYGGGCCGNSDNTSVYGGGKGGYYTSYACSTARNGRPATTYGSGGGGSFGDNYRTCTCTGGAGCQGIVVVRYPTDGSYGINCATGGNVCRTCTIDGIEYCIHEFTTNGTFTIVS